MKSMLIIIFLSNFLMCQDWIELKSEKMRVQISIPEDFKTSNNESDSLLTLHGISKDGEVGVYLHAYPKSSLTLNQQLDQSMKELEFRPSRDIDETDINDFECLIAEGFGMMADKRVAMLIFISKNLKYKFAYYIFCDAEKKGDYAEFMIRLMTSFKEIE